MKQVKLILKRFLSLFPSALPTGRTEFDKFSNDIIELVEGLADDNSLKFAISTMIMHLGPQRSHVSKNYFVQSLRKTAANQVAHAVLQELKNEQIEKAKKAEEEAKKQAEDTAKQQGQGSGEKETQGL